jgi:hypothetical protein
MAEKQLALRPEVEERATSLIQALVVSQNEGLSNYSPRESRKQVWTMRMSTEEVLTEKGFNSNFTVWQRLFYFSLSTFGSHLDFF